MIEKIIGTKSWMPKYFELGGNCYVNLMPSQDSVMVFSVQQFVIGKMLNYCSEGYAGY